MDQLPETDVIMVPVGGGGLLSGITEYVKHVKPETLIYVRICFFIYLQKCKFSFFDLLISRLSSPGRRTKQRLFFFQGYAE